MPDLWNVLGVDPGARCGWALMQAEARGLPTLVDCGTISASGPPHVKRGQVLARLARIFKANEITHVAVEAGFVGPIVQKRGKKAGQKVDPINSALALGKARGLPEALAGMHRCEYREYAPATLKKVATGNGRADKAQMRRAVCAMFGLKAIGEDAADAVAAALCMVRELQAPQQMEMVRR